MKTFWLKVIASDRVAYNGRCQKVIVPAADGGQMGILADHENMVIAIEVGEAKMQSIQEYYHTKASLARAMNRLKVSREKNTRI